jgi:DNA adenine methylase
LTNIPKWDILGFIRVMDDLTQLTLLEVKARGEFKLQLLKWIGNKQRFASEIIAHFPAKYGAYFEPFLGSGSVLATLAPGQAVASDCFAPLMEIWETLKDDPELLKSWYADRWQRMNEGEKKDAYEAVKLSYNQNPNGADLLFLCRSCYGGVVRFRQGDGYMSTPCGIHAPISPDSFARRVDVWRNRVEGTDFRRMDYSEAMALAERGDLIYCDPPYSHTQAILYGAQQFSLEALFEEIAKCKARGVRVVLSIDGKKKSGAYDCALPIPKGLFKREIFIECGRSMLRRFQMDGHTLEDHCVSDRLLLTY